MRSRRSRGRPRSRRARSRTARSSSERPKRPIRSKTPGEGGFHVFRGVPIDDRLGAYADLVRAYAERLDLVAPGDLDRFEERHIRDSLKPLALLGALPDGPCVDV